MLFDPIGRFAQQDIDQMPCPEPLTPFAPQSVDSRQHLLGRHRPIPCLWCFQAGITVTARFDLLIKIRQQALSTARDGFTQTEHGIQSLTLLTPVRRIAL